MLKKTTKFIFILSTAISLASISGCTSAHKTESTGQYIDSSVITATVKARLLADDTVSGLPITVKTYKNNVQLSGFVNNQAQRIRATEIARHVQGVEFVQDSLLIKRR